MGIMSTNSIEQISLRSLNHSEGTSRSRIYSTETLNVEDSFVNRSPSAAESRDLDEPVPIISSGGYLDGGYGWVVTAGV